LLPTAISEIKRPENFENMLLDRLDQSISVTIAAREEADVLRD
jgi:hypothetical protein